MSLRLNVFEHVSEFPFLCMMPGIEFRAEIELPGGPSLQGGVRVGVPSGLGHGRRTGHSIWQILTLI